MIDDRELYFPVHNQQLIAHLCDRRFGIGADGLILVQPHAEMGLYMKYFNADGNESSMCGNGGRCFAAFAAQLGLSPDTIKFMAIDGPHDAVIHPEENNSRWIKLKMKPVTGAEQRNQSTFVLNTGSPHYIQFLDEKLAELDLVPQAKKIRYNDEFAAAGINVNYINEVNETVLSIRTYERGVEDETLSCGTGVTAAALSLALRKQLPSDHYLINLKTMGGDLKVSYDFDAAEKAFSNIWLQGPATFVYEGFVEC